MEGFLSKIPEPEVEEKKGLTAQELETLMADKQNHVHDHVTNIPHTHRSGLSRAEWDKRRAKKKMADKSRRRNRK